MTGHTDHDSSTLAKERWLATLWPTIHSQLPKPNASVVELGCGSLGGFVPMLRNSGYDATGIDPSAPEGDCYQRVEFERSELPDRLQVVVACTSLHHVAEPDEVLDRIATALAADGRVIVVEWDWQSFDEATAHWCFERLDPSGPENWLHRGRAGWAASGGAWEDYLRNWAADAGVHSARGLIESLDQRFQRLQCGRGPYFFPELSGTSEADELEAIAAGQIKANRIDYVGRVR